MNWVNLTTEIIIPKKSSRVENNIMFGVGGLVTLFAAIVSIQVQFSLTPKEPTHFTQVEFGW